MENCAAAGGLIKQQNHVTVNNKETDEDFIIFRSKGGGGKLKSFNARDLCKFIGQLAECIWGISCLTFHVFESRLSFIMMAYHVRRREIRE